MVLPNPENSSIPAAERRLRSQIAAHTSWANTEDRTARTGPARAAFEQRFLDQAGGDPVRAAHIRKSHFARLALQSAASRRKARDLNAIADAAERELDNLGEAS